MKPSARSLLLQILKGGRLEDKLAGLGVPPARLDWESGWDEPFTPPEHPGREGALAPQAGSHPVGVGPNGGSERKSDFPRKSDLTGPEASRHRGRVLHYFANHELLAIETMAFTLLRFPDAPVEFKQGVFRILHEEQQHLSMYLERMRGYGVKMGEVPLNFYFWNSLKTLASPMDFVTRMSLTFEQANLDFALEYARVFEELGDADTAALLQKVHDDEVTHVAHGLYWFNKWRAEADAQVDGLPGGTATSEWDDYRRRLPFPMSARRARGSTAFFADESRRQAGFSEEYIESVRITGGSRGRVPELWLYNPQCELEASGVELSRAARDKIADFEPVLFWFAQESDLVLQEREPPRAWLREVFEARGELPEWMRAEEALAGDRPVERVRPWGWGRSAFALERALGSRLRRRQPLASADFDQKLLSKAWWKERLGTPGAVVRSREELEAWIASRPASESAWILKDAHSTSGRGHRVLKRDDIVQNRLKGRALFGQKGPTPPGSVVEPYHDKLVDFSVQYELAADGRLRAWEPRLFETDSRHQYVRSFLGVAAGGERRAWHRELEIRRPDWSSAHERVAETLRAAGYHGPFGIDGLLARGEGGALAVVPVIEVNVRLTMGRLAHEIERCRRRLGGTGEGELRLLTAAQAPEGFVAWVAREREARGHDRVWCVTPPDNARSSLIVALF